LYAYADRIHFYTRLGFVHDSDFSVLTGKGFSSPPKPNLRPAKETETENIIEYDRTCFGAPRGKMLKPILSDPDNICFVSMDEGKMCGYAVAKISRGNAELGPLGCAEGRSDIAIDLLKATLSELKEKEVSMLIPKKERTILNVLKQSGFIERFQVARMFHGPLTATRCIYMAESLERG
jgi:hypothetical protein